MSISNVGIRRGIGLSGLQTPDRGAPVRDGGPIMTKAQLEAVTFAIQFDNRQPPHDDHDVRAAAAVVVWWGSRCPL